MGERILTTLRLDGVPVADYVDGSQLDPELSPRPYLHPGGLFWRLPPAREPHVSTATAEGEHAVHNSIAPWLAWADRTSDFTLAFTGADEASRADPWFVRVANYPGVGSQLAARDPVTLAPGDAAMRGLRVLVADGLLDEETVQTWATAANGDPVTRPPDDAVHHPT